MRPDAGRLLRAAIDLTLVGAAVGYTASFFPADVLLTETTASGGDMGSHYYPGLFMKEQLLPNGEVSGWDPGNYAGYPVFQFYFPLPFMIMAALSAAIPYSVAFKLGTILGTLLIPVCAYFGLRLLRAPFPGPAIGALATLCFTFMEANTMWGGNIPSTLAGEFSFSLGLALTLLFFGALHRAAETGRGVVWAGGVEALVGLAHGYTLLWAGFGSLVELIASRGWWRRVGVMFGVHGLAILLLAFWLFPLFGYAPWTTAYNHAWPLGWEDWQEVLPPILWPATAVALATLAVEGILSVRRRTAFPRGLAVLWGTLGVAGLFYFTGHSFHVVDIRFLPFVQIGLCLAAGAGLGHVLARLPYPALPALAAPLLILPFVQGHVTFIHDWVKWNYSGFEARTTWPVLRGLSDHLRGDFRAPRVVYEHAPENEALGTVRAFESLPLFSGRSTLEGLYMQSSPTSPFVFYVQSELSPLPSCPFPDWSCARFNIDHGVAHLRMMNVSDLIVRTDRVKKAAAAHPGLEKVASEGRYEIHRVIENDPRYAIPLTDAPQLVLTEDWKVPAYHWFRGARPGDVVPVFAEEAAAEEEALFSAVSDGLPESFERRPLAAPPTLSEEMPTPDRVVVTGATPGHPVLIRISYHPRWHAATGEKIWLAGPSFMLVFPKGDRVELAFGDGPPVVIGRWATRLGALLFLAAVLPLVGPVFRRGLAGARERLAVLPPAHWIVGPVRRTSEWGAPLRRALAGGGLLLALVVVVSLALALRRVPTDALYRSGLALMQEGKLAEARGYFQAVQHESPLSTDSIHSRYFEGTTHIRAEEWKEAEDVFGRLVRDFPDGLNAPEALYHVGIARNRQGNAAGAREAWEQTRERYPDSRWAEHATVRISELPAGS
ncbi:MAG: 6-pyruvoyl-tetrahydropterin synthase-related protein [Myxococcota bacterium]